MRYPNLTMFPQLWDPSQSPSQPSQPASQPSPAPPVLWAASKSADPGEACGVVVIRKEQLVGEIVAEWGGRWAGKQIRELRHRGVRRGMCNPLQPARSPALSEGLGEPGLNQRAPQGGQESFGTPRNRFRVPFSTLRVVLSAHLGFSESSTSLGSSKVDRS